jgi:hypothetical protein
LTRAPFAGRLVLPVASLVLLLELAFGNRYGYHRDELYFRTAARHPALAYDDQGVLTPFAGRLSEVLFGETPRGLRVFSALAVAAAVVLVALLARELGASGAGQLVAASGAAAAGFVLAVGHLLSTATFDLLVWIGLLLVVARILGGGDERLWLVAGLVVGIGLENKQLPLLLVAALALGLALDRKLPGILCSPWLWGGVAIAAALWLPGLVALVLATAGKPYYTAPYLLVLLAAGSVQVERWLTSRPRQLAIAACLLVSAAAAVLITLPVLPADRLQSTPIPDLDEDAIETVGWPALVRTVARVYDSLPERERRTAVVFTGNYGEAGAVDRSGPDYGLPRAYSGHNAYARFGIPPGSSGPVIVLGYDAPSVDFTGCRRAATIDNGVGLDNEEQGGAVFVCARPRRPWADAWKGLRHLDA